MGVMKILTSINLLWDIIFYYTDITSVTISPPLQYRHCYNSDAIKEHNEHLIHWNFMNIFKRSSFIYRTMTHGIYLVQI